MFIGAQPVGVLSASELPTAKSSDSVASEPVVSDDRTRDRVLRYVSEGGPVTAAELAEQLELTATAVRRHLDALVDSGDLAATEVIGRRRGRGRPARAYVVTPSGHRRMTTEYDDVATAALRFMADRLGPGAVATFAEERLAELEQRYGPSVAAAGDDPTARTHALAQALAKDGFAASTRPVGNPDSPSGLQLCQGHCPMHEVALQFPQFCDAETEAFARLLGVHVQRLATLAHGEHVCTTFVPLTGATASADSPTHVRPPATASAATQENRSGS